MAKTGSLRVHSVGDPGGRPLVLLHGFLGDSRDWDEVAGALSGQFFCIIPDLPGHGASAIGDVDPEQGMDYVALSLLGMLEFGPSGPVDIIGYSMGGRIALHFALRYPQRCRRLVLESASPGLTDPAERAARREHDDALACRLEEGPLEAFLRDWYGQPLFASLARDPGRVRGLIERRSGANRAGLARALRAFSTGAQEPLWEKLQDAPPSLLIVGGEDAKFKEIAGRMAQCMPDAAVEVIEGAGHNVHLERPDRFIEVVSQFLSR